VVKFCSFGGHVSVFANCWTSSGVESGRHSHGRRFPSAVSDHDDDCVRRMASLLSATLKTAAARLRVATFISMVCSLVFLFVGVIMVDMKSGGFFGLVLMRSGTIWIIPHPYDYYLFHITLPIARAVFLSIALLCPIAYVSWQSPISKNVAPF